MTRSACEVVDDGTGFDVAAARARVADDDAPPGFGLAGMRERVMLAGGALDIASAPGGGTTVRARFPLPRGQAGGATSSSSPRSSA